MSDLDKPSKRLAENMQTIEFSSTLSLTISPPSLPVSYYEKLNKVGSLLIQTLETVNELSILISHNPDQYFSPQALIEELTYLETIAEQLSSVKSRIPHWEINKSALDSTLPEDNSGTPSKQ